MGGTAGPASSISVTTTHKRTSAYFFPLIKQSSSARLADSLTVPVIPTNGTVFITIAVVTDGVGAVDKYVTD